MNLLQPIFRDFELSGIWIWTSKLLTAYLHPIDIPIERLSMSYTKNPHWTAFLLLQGEDNENPVTEENNLMKTVKMEEHAN